MIDHLFPHGPRLMIHSMPGAEGREETGRIERIPLLGQEEAEGRYAFRVVVAVAGELVALPTAQPETR